MSTIIEAKEPVEVPAKEASVYDKLWIKNFRIVSDSPSKVFVGANLVPFNGTDILDAPIESVAVDNVLAAMQDEERPAELRELLGQAMGVILMALKAEMAYQDAKKEEPIVEE